MNERRISIDRQHRFQIIDIVGLKQCDVFLRPVPQIMLVSECGIETIQTEPIKETVYIGLSQRVAIIKFEARVL